MSAAQPRGTRVVPPFALISALLFSGLALAQAPSPPTSPTPVSNHEYDPKGRPLRTTVAPGGLNLTQSATYDRLGRARTQVDPAGGTTRMGVDATNALTAVDDPRSLRTTYDRTAWGELLTLTSPDTGATTQTLDAAGRVSRTVDARGVTADFSYDALSRPTRIQYSGSGQSPQVLSWTYDQTGPDFGAGIGRLTSTGFPVGNSRFTYDALGRVTAYTLTVTADTSLVRSVRYDYDAAGRLAGITYPSGRRLLYRRAAGLVDSMALIPAAGGSPVEMLDTIRQDSPAGSDGLVRSWRWVLSSGPQPHAREFDLSGRMVRYPVGGALRDITYDAADRITAYTHRDAASGQPSPAATALDQRFEYDAASRITLVESTAGRWTFGYDANGNRTRSVFVLGTTTQARTHQIAATSNRLTSLSNPPRTLTQDAAGNAASDTEGTRQWTATYDLRGRLQALSTSIGVGDRTTEEDIEYGQDAEGRRVLKRVPYSVTCQGTGPQICTPRTPDPGIVFVHDLDGRLLGEYRLPQGDPIREYVWLHDMPVAVLADEYATPTNPNAVFYVHTDHLNTPRVVIDRSGAQRWAWMAEPFGNSAPTENPTGRGAFVLNLRMPGQYFDREAGLLQNWNREYDAAVGRYTQSDPIGLAGGINTYAYVGSAPTMYTDPNGLQAVPAPGPIPIPLPPVFIPGTPENQRFVDTTWRIIKKIGDMCTPSESDREKECKEQLDREEKLCVAIAGSRYGGDKATAIRICQSAAMKRYAACLRGTPPEQRPPLTGVDTPI